MMTVTQRGTLLLSVGCIDGLLIAAERFTRSPNPSDPALLPVESTKIHVLNRGGVLGIAGVPFIVRGSKPPVVCWDSIDSFTKAVGKRQLGQMSRGDWDGTRKRIVRDLVTAQESIPIEKRLAQGLGPKGLLTYFIAWHVDRKSSFGLTTFELYLRGPLASDVTIKIAQDGEQIYRNSIMAYGDTTFISASLCNDDDRAFAVFRKERIFDWYWDDESGRPPEQMKLPDAIDLVRVYLRAYATAAGNAVSGEVPADLLLLRRSGDVESVG